MKGTVFELFFFFFLLSFKLKLVVQILQIFHFDFLAASFSLRCVVLMLTSFSLLLFLLKFKSIFVVTMCNKIKTVCNKCSNKYLTKFYSTILLSFALLFHCAALALAQGWFTSRLRCTFHCLFFVVGMIDDRTKPTFVFPFLLLVFKNNNHELVIIVQFWIWSLVFFWNLTLG